MQKIPTAYRTMKVKDLLFEGESVANAMPTNYAFLVEVPAHVPTAAMIRQVVQELRAAFEAALAHDSNRIKERNDKQAELVMLLDGVAKHYESVGITHPEVFTNTGFSATKPRRRGLVPLLPSPYDFVLLHGPQPGSLIARSSKLANAKCYELHIALNDPGIHQNWGHSSTVIDPNAVVYGLQSGKEIWAKWRGINGAGPGAWSPVLSFIPK